MNPSEAEAIFLSAVELHKKGQLDQAQTLYERLLKAYPNHHHALHLLGVIVSQNGDQFYARRLMESALMLTPYDADMQANLAQVLLHLGLLEDALQRCDQSIALQPTNARCHLTRGKALQFLAQHEKAIGAFDQALQHQPDWPEVLHLRGLCLHALGRFDEALSDYDQALQLKPDHADALSNRGFTLFVLQRPQEAIDSLLRALEMSPRFPEALYHLGVVLQHEQRYEEALARYSQAIQLRPDYDQALVRQSFIMHKLGIPVQRCIATLDRALRANPNLVAALSARGGLLAGLKMLDDALLDYDRALALEPNDAKTHSDRGEALLLLKRHDEAIDAFRRGLALGRLPSEMNYVLASLGAQDAPPTAPSSYVVNLFDWYADHFDDHLQVNLKYQTPALLCRELLQLGALSNLDILDLGCGTGLCSPHLKPLARTLAGVDLSPKMLEMARQRALYDHLVCSDLSTFLDTRHDCFDLVIATDVFIYVGALEAVFERTRKALRAGGLFAFSIESSQEQELVLRPTRRYAHSEGYLRRLASLFGFDFISLKPSVIREEGGQDQDGYLVVLRAA